ncbi:hypothetical protein NE237_026093 [Protea cynaroides]|uniref:PGG domain-containing protein n=1 Tax=Protea cynaroides TaxID=273540 RepID=A0A9Q0K151_9MAGN|nr:hypothetical protein NE237_026093 [Protea cynaroides]
MLSRHTDSNNFPSYLVQLVELLLHRYRRIVRKAVLINSENKDGLTALDILLEVPRGHDQGRVESILVGFGAKRAHDVDRHGTGITISVMMKWVFTSYVKPVLNYINFTVNPNTPSDTRNALFVVIALISTASYQTGITPPGGYWQEDYINNGTDNPSTRTHLTGD